MIEAGLEGDNQNLHLQRDPEGICDRERSCLVSKCELPPESHLRPFQLLEYHMTGRRLFWVNKLYLHADGGNMNLLLWQPQCLRLLLPIIHSPTLPSCRMKSSSLFSSPFSQGSEISSVRLCLDPTLPHHLPLSKTLPLSLTAFLPLSSHPLSWPLFQILPVVKNI